MCAPLLLAACNSSASLSTERRPAATQRSEQALQHSADSPSTSLDADGPAWATSTVVEVDPVSLAAIGPRMPSGYWSEGSAVTDDVIAIVTWPDEEMAVLHPVSEPQIAPALLRHRR